MFQWNTPVARPPEDLIHRLCRESGRWRLVEREGDRYHVVADDGSPLQPIWLRYRQGRSESIPLQSRFPVRFPLDNPPSGLFGRLLMRNFTLVHAYWAVNLGESCEALLWVLARVSVAGLDAKLFDMVCREMRDEIVAFHRELKDKLRYSVSGMMPDDGGDARTMEMRYAESVEPAPPPALPSAEEAWRMIQEQGGPRRYRLPGPRE